MNHFTPRGLRNAGDYIAREAEFGARNYKPLDVVLSRGEGVYVWDVDGRRYWIACRPIPPLIRVIAIPASWRR